MHYRIHRAGDVDLTFDGELIADESTRDDNRLSQNQTSPDRQKDPTRWTEVRIYRVATGGWVTETVGKSSRAGEVDRPRVNICSSPHEVRESLRRRPGEYIINVALDALEEAAEHDPTLLTATSDAL